MSSQEQLQSVLNYVKSTFVGKDDIIDLLGISLVARENTFLLGPPGTAKSAIVRQLSSCIEGGKNFEYLLTRFTEPNEIFGPFDIRKLRDGELVTNTEGMLPEASMVFLDEIFNANSAILNSLLMALNEKTFKRGKETKAIPALMFVGASNALPEDEALNALLDRFLIRVLCDYVDTDQLESVLVAGWSLGKNNASSKPSIQPTAIQELQQLAREVDLSATRATYIDLVHSLRNSGIKVSDRRAVKVQSLIAASAVISGRDYAILSDLWVMKYIWDTEEQIEILAGMIDQVISSDKSEKAHPQSNASSLPNAEEIAKDLRLLKSKIEEAPDAATLHTIKDKLRYLQNRVTWIHQSEQKESLDAMIHDLWTTLK